MRKLNRLTMTLALLLTAVGGAWAEDYTTVFELNGSTASTGTLTLGTSSVEASTVNIHENTDEIAGIKISSSYNYEDGKYFTIAPETGSFKKGDKVSIAVCFNNSNDAKTAKAAIYAADGTTLLYTTEKGINGRTTNNDPVVEEYVLPQDASVLYIGRNGNTATFVTTLKVERPASAEPAVTINDAKTEASFVMPTSDVDFSYELVRDMSVKMSAEVGDGSDGYRIRIKKNDNNDFVPVNADEMLISVSDDLDEQHPNLTVNTDFTLLVQKKGEGDTWTDLSNDDKISVGTFRYKVTGVGNYIGTIYSNEFELYQGYEIKVAAGEYATYYKDEALKVEDEEVELLTITAVESGKAVLSDASDAMPENTPFLVHNNGTEEKTILLIPCNEPNLAVTVAKEFKGTEGPRPFSEAEMADGDFYVCNGKEFIKVRGEGTLAANKAFLFVEGNNTPASIPFRRSIDGNGEGTTGIDNLNANDNEATWYDLGGRKLNGKPAQKGIYIKNGKKVIVK